MEAFAKTDAIRRSEFKHEFPVVVRVTAPKKAASNSNVDFVVVIDISANMSLEMLQNVKQAMLDVVNDLGSEDRFSMVFSSSKLQHCTPLTHHNDVEAAFSNVNDFVAMGKSDIPAALQQATKIIKARTWDESINRNSFIVLFSASNDDSIYTEPIRDEFPVYTFGLGEHHDPRAMFLIAENTCGTYSFIVKDMEKMGSALVKFIQMEKSVIEVNIKIRFRTDGGVKISSINSGSRNNGVTDKKMSGLVEINRLYAGQELMFTVFLNVPKATNQSLIKKLTVGDQAMKLMTVGGMSEGICVDKPVEVVIKRTSDNMPNGKVCPVVAAELKRLELVRDISDLSKNPTADGVETMYKLHTSEDYHLVSKWKLEEHIWEMRKGISNANNHRMQGLQYMLSWLSSHNWQRATAMGSPYIPDNFLPTSTMQNHTMCRTSLHLLPSTIFALVMLLLAVLFSIYTGMILKLWPALQLMMTSSTVAMVMNRAIQQYLYSAVTIFGAFSTFVSKEVISIELTAHKLEKEKDEDMKIFRQTNIPECANIVAYRKACGGRAGMPTIHISEI